MFHEEWSVSYSTADTLKANRNLNLETLQKGQHKRQVAQTVQSKIEPNTHFKKKSI